MLITISGTQGQGKTTVIEDVKRQYDIKSVPIKTSRSILNDWGYTLEEINRYPPLTKKFQDEILNRHYEFSKQYLESEDFFLSERSYADMYTYTMFAMGSFNEYSSWMDEYYTRCCELQKKYAGVIYLSGRKDYNPEEDGVRSINQQFCDSVDVVNRHFTEKMTEKDKLFHCDIVSREGRVNYVLDIISDLEYRQWQ